jgi:translocation and assembly module TamB
MSRRILIWLLWCLAALIFILTMVAAALWMMPRAVSTNWSKKQIETRTSRALHAAVTLDALRWTWEEGIQIQGLRIADDEAFSRDPIISLDRLILKMDPGQLIDRRLYLDLQMEGLKASLIRETDGRTNLETWLARLQPAGRPPAETRLSEAQDWRKIALALPGDLTAHIRLQRGAILVEDRQEERSLSIRDITLLVNIPSLVNKPISLSLSSTQKMDGNPLPPVDLTLSVEHLVDPTPAVRLSTALIKARCRLPGLDLAVSGGLSDMGIQAKMDLDLAALMKAAGPLVPSSLPTVSGKIGLMVKAELASGNEIAYDMTLSGTRLAVEGGPLKERRIGPVAIQFSQTGTADPQKRELNIIAGELRIQEKTRLGWEGRVRQTDTSGVEADLSMNGVSVDLKEMIGLAGSFIPMDIVAGWSPEIPQGLYAERAQLNGALPAGPVRASVKGLKVELPGLKLAHSKNGLSADGVYLLVTGADIRLQDQFPTSLDVIADLNIQRLSLSGGQPIHVYGLKAADVHVTARDLARSPKALLGMAGTVSLTESLTVEQMDAPGLAFVPDIRHDLKGSVLMQDQPPFTKLSVRTAVASPAPRIDSLSKRPIEEGARLEVRVEDLDIAALTPLLADVGRLEASVRLGNIVDLQIEGEAAALGVKALTLNGHSKIDLNLAGAFIPASVKPKGTFTGTLEADWQFKGRRPTPNEVKTFSDRGLSLASRFDALDFINMAELKASLKNVGLDLTLKGGLSLSAHGIRSLSPLTVTAAKGLKSVLMEGSLAVGQISQLPGSKPFTPPLSAAISFKVNQQDLLSLQITESLHIDPLNIDQDLHISLNRLGRLLNLEEQMTLSTLLRHLDIAASAGLRAALSPSLSPFTPGLSLKGSVDARLGLELKGGKEISGRMSLESGGLDVAARQARIQGLTSHIHLSKTYQLRFGKDEEDKPGATSAFLSQKVLGPSAASELQPPSGNALARRLVDDLGGRMSGPPTLSFDAVHLMGSPFPLELRHGEMQFRLAESLPSLDRFQFNTMGGSILGDLRITRKNNRCLMEMKGAFSGLDAATLLPEQASAERAALRGPDPDTQVSGQVSLQMPISQDPVQVMNNLGAAVHLTHIGSRTLERLLYAMDPYEANEGIVKQRALLRKGTPEWVDVQIRHGSLSLSGSVAAAGARISLPPVERLNLTNLPIHNRLQKILKMLGPVENGLKALSAGTILINEDSSIQFVENTP